jgi:hypothetical protein
MREQSVSKFRCVSKTQTADGFSVTMVPVTSGSEDNDRIFKGTPAGCLEISNLHTLVSARFQVNQCYTLTIEEVEQ